MPSAFLRFADLRSAGATVDVRLARPISSVTQRRKPNPGLPAIALIDTGSSATVLKEGLPAALGLKPTSTTYVNTASASNVLCEEFAVTFLVHGLSIRTTALELPLCASGIDCLIGRDVLAQCVMTYIGPDNQVILSF